jgi:anti-sigma-K factor RskA
MTVRQAHIGAAASAVAAIALYSAGRLSGAVEVHDTTPALDATLAVGPALVSYVVTWTAIYLSRERGLLGRKST